MDNKNFRSTLSKRILLFAVTLAFIILVILFRLLLLQVVSGDKYRTEANNRRTNVVNISAERGIIYDRNEHILAENKKVFNLYINKDNLNEDQLTILIKVIAPIINENENTIRDRLVKSYSLIKNQLDPMANEIITSIKSKAVGLSYEKTSNNEENRVDNEENKKYYLKINLDKLEDVDPEKLASNIALVSKLNYEDLMALFDKNNNGAHKISISKEVYERLSLVRSTHVNIITEDKRFYPFSTVASSVIGFTNDQNVGFTGIEKAMDKILRGKDGKSVSVTSLNKGMIPFEQANLYAPEKGQDIVLTIDDKIQTFVEEAGRNTLQKLKAKTVSIIVMNPQTGEVLGMQNFPELNLNSPRQGRNQTENLELANAKNEKDRLDVLYGIWRNIAISNIYEPGSVFKTITLASALEEGTTSLENHYFCNGFVRDIPGVVIRCVSWAHPHGDQTLQQAFTNSCNPSFVQIGRDLGREKFAKYIRAFGFGNKTGIDLDAEEKGIAYTNPDKIGEARLATMSYGHGIAVTPIQMLTACNAVINGGYILEPKVVLGPKVDGKVIKSDPIVKRQVISESTSDTVKKMLRRVVEDGAKDAMIPGYSVGGKSGTTIKIVDGKYTSDKVVASFFGCFPAEKPEYSILVVIDEPENGLNGTSAAGPVVKEIFSNIIKYKGIESTEPLPDESKKTVVVPDIVGITLKDATLKLQKLNLKTSIHTVTSDPNIIVTTQNPKPGSKAFPEDTIYLEADATKTAMVKMPNLINKSLAGVQEELAKLNLHYKIENYSEGKVIQTTPEEGIFIEPGSEILIKFFDKKKEEELQNKSKQEEKKDKTSDTDKKEDTNTEKNQNSN